MKHKRHDPPIESDSSRRRNPVTRLCVAQAEAPSFTATTNEGSPPPPLALPHNLGRGFSFWRVTRGLGGWPGAGLTPATGLTYATRL
jgi:hypothetical protein